MEFLNSSPNLPPGCRFYPSEEQLLDCYLRHKNNNSNNNPELQLPSQCSSLLSAHYCDTIKEISLYNYSPFELPEVTCFPFGCKGRKRHWYCFVSADVERGDWRKAGVGYWKRKGKVRVVKGGNGNVVLGRRKCFIFYLDKLHGKPSVRTHWLMYEYALLDNIKLAKIETEATLGLSASFVVCRIFSKSSGRKSISEHALSSCAEESIAAVRHIGIQHDGSTISVLGEDKTIDCDYVNAKIGGQQTDLIEETELNNSVQLPGLAGSTGLLADSLTHHLTSLIEGDFIELDDLL